MMKLLIGDKYIEIKEAKTFKERLKGLMGQKNISYGMLFRNCNSIHTYFMQEAIDVIGLNEGNEIIFKEENLRPNKLIMIHRSLKKTSILELPHHTSQSLNIGDKIKFD